MTSSHKLSVHESFKWLLNSSRFLVKRSKNFPRGLPFGRQATFSHCRSHYHHFVVDNSFFFPTLHYIVTRSRIVIFGFDCFTTGPTCYHFVCRCGHRNATPKPKLAMRLNQIDAIAAMTKLTITNRRLYNWTMSCRRAENEYHGDENQSGRKQYNASNSRA